MVVRSGRHLFGNDQGRILLMTARDGFGAQVGHDLTIEISVWSGEVTVADDGSLTDLIVRADLNSLTVREGRGGVKPLTDRDRREIATTARKCLGVGRYPAATFTASEFESDSNGGGFLQGTLSLAGATRPLRLHVASAGPGSYHATASVRQSEFGIKPYSAFLGALKVSDVVGVSVDLDLPGESGNGDAQP
jgi:polyisoprenoid-binding protein YceI